MGDVEVVARIVLRQREVLATFAVVGLVLATVAAWCARNRGWSTARTWWAGLAGAAFALVPATTLAREGLWLGRGSCQTTPGLSLTTPEATLNALLFTPAAFFGVLALRRPVLVALLALACSAAIEVTQLVTGLGSCQAADVVRNVAGAVVAAAAAAAAGGARASGRFEQVHPGVPLDHDVRGGGEELVHRGPAT